MVFVTLMQSLNNETMLFVTLQATAHLGKSVGRIWQNIPEYGGMTCLQSFTCQLFF